MELNFTAVALFLVLAFSLSVFVYYMALYIKSQTDIAKIKKVINQEKEQILMDTRLSRKKDIQSGSEFSGFLKKIDEKLEFAGVEQLNPYAFIMIVATFAMSGAFLFYFMVHNPIAAFAGLLIFGYLPINLLGTVITMRVSSFNIALSEAISLVVRMMRNGVGFEQALKRAVEISQSKLFREAFGVYLKEKDIIGDEAAFEKMQKKVDSNEARIFSLSILVGKSSGGKFSNTLEKLDASIKDRVKLQRKIAVATREAKVGSYAIIAIIGLIFVLMNKSLNNMLVEHFFYKEDGKLEFMFIMLWVMIGLFLNSTMSKVR